MDDKDILINKLRLLIDDLWTATYVWDDLPEHVIDILQERVDEACPVKQLTAAELEYNKQLFDRTLAWCQQQPCTEPNG
jgi:hypothetical protein